MDVPGRIESVDQLAGLYRAPSARAAGKVVTRIDDASARFIDRCTFVVVSTSDGHGSSDASPRGGPPGFVQRLDERHVAIPDLVGNNRLDSLRNIVARPHAGLLLVVPGRDETLRINGPAALTVDPGILSGFTGELRRPKLAIVVETAELYGHCAKAFRRARLWDPPFWAEVDDAPDLAEIYACQFDGTDAREVRATVEAIYAEDLACD
ncbi:MAG TPA: MSMEG_1061 family FMN-dependent PPOX-type flavoprotein [Acidimicrobiales bacterium]